MALSKVKRSYFNGKSHLEKTQNCLEGVTRSLISVHCLFSQVSGDSHGFYFVQNSAS